MNVMEAPEEQVSLGSKEQRTHIIKGKRSKRVRPQSPIPFTVTANSSNGVAHTEDHSHFNAHNYDDDDDDNDYDDDAINNNNITTCSAELQCSTEEEEDMANCLILLAQGQSWESPKPFEQDDKNNGLNYSMYSSRKFMETVTMGYECKTCNRTFPSFQALGGHRASHKKPKASLMAFDDAEEFQFKNKNPFSLQLNNNNNTHNSRGNNLCGNNKNRSKVHECSVCGAEFTSGQALGGHMRRHRAPVGTANTTLSLTPMATLESDEDRPKKRRKLLSLDLDLNLPAPENDQREPKFAFGSKQRQHQPQEASLVFCAPSLVDCHY